MKQKPTKRKEKKRYDLIRNWPQNIILIYNFLKKGSEQYFPYLILVLP